MLSHLPREGKAYKVKFKWRAGLLTGGVVGAEFAAFDAAPGGFVLAVTEGGLHLIDGVHLAVAEVIHYGIEEELQDLADAGIFAEGVFLQQEGTHGEDDAVQHRHQEEADHKVEIHDAEEERDRHRDIAQHLKERADEFKDPEVGQAEHADAAVLRAEGHVFMAEERIDKADVPALALLFQVGKVIRGLRPADGIRQELDGIRALVAEHIAVELHDELHILADAARGVAAGLDDRLLVEGAESAGDDEQHAHFVKADTAGEKGAEILIGLEH